MAEQVLGKDEVVGSIPIPGSIPHAVIHAMKIRLSGHVARDAAPVKRKAGLESRERLQLERE